MIKDIKRVKKKYEQMRKTAEYVDIGQVIGDLHQLIMECRLRRIPKSER